MATDNKPVIIIRADADGTYRWHDLDTGERGVLADGECLKWPPGSSAPPQHEEPVPERHRPPVHNRAARPDQSGRPAAVGQPGPN